MYVQSELDMKKQNYKKLITNMMSIYSLGAIKSFAQFSPVEESDCASSLNITISKELILEHKFCSQIWYRIYSKH